MVSRFVSMALAFALAATVSFAAGESDSAGAAAAADKKYVTDPTNGKVYTAPEYGGTLTYGSSQEPPNSDAIVGGINAGFAASGVVEKLGIAKLGHRSERETISPSSSCSRTTSPGLWPNAGTSPTLRPISSTSARAFAGTTRHR